MTKEAKTGERASFAPDQAFKHSPANAPKRSEGPLASAGSLAPVEQARLVLEKEAQAISALAKRLSNKFEEAINLLYNCQGKVIVSGIGKSGHIGRKIAATLASTGTPAFFVHTAELKHGDLGMIDEKDVVIVLSGSGETPEIVAILDSLKRLGVKLISLTGKTDSALGRFSDVCLDVSVSQEACPHNLAPTTSTTCALAMGDALAIVLMMKKDFRAEDFARSHPGGSLGRQLVTVKDVMRSGLAVPIVELKTSYEAVLREIDQKKLGFTTVCNEDGGLMGIITDGDLRRSLLRLNNKVFQLSAGEMMTANPKTISSNSLAVEALKIMERYAISDLLIVDEKQKPLGLIDLKDLLRAGIF
jgi:arabinose-5-phosphate isomerase